MQPAILQPGIPESRRFDAELWAARIRQSIVAVVVCCGFARTPRFTGSLDGSISLTPSPRKSISILPSLEKTPPQGSSGQYLPHPCTRRSPIPAGGQPVLDPLQSAL